MTSEYPPVCGDRSARYCMDVNYDYLLTPWSRVLPEKPAGPQLVRKVLALYATRSFVTSFTIARHMSYSEPDRSQSMSSQPTSRRSVLILSCHLGLCLSSCPLPSGFFTKTLYTPLLSRTRPTCSAHLSSWLDHRNRRHHHHRLYSPRWALASLSKCR